MAALLLMMRRPLTFMMATAAATCGTGDPTPDPDDSPTPTMTQPADPTPTFGPTPTMDEPPEPGEAGVIDLGDLYNYEAQAVPRYIDRDNTGGNDIEDEVATLGRVLFYDVNLSSDRTVACASCHLQAFAFSDPDTLSQGVNGVTGRHAMRLVNARFANERRFFWDERADTLEMQTTMPIQDHAEMGFSGTMGDPDFDDLTNRLEGIPYYQDLFMHIYGDTNVTEARMQEAMAQFIRSIQSFDTRYDMGLEVVGDPNAPFPNFTDQENQGKQLFTQAPQFQAPAPGQTGSGLRTGGGLGCQGCHAAPEFDIDPNSLNNAVLTVAGAPGEEERNS